MASRKPTVKKSATPRKRRKRRKKASDKHSIWDSPQFMPEATSEHRQQYRDVNIAREHLESKYEALRIADGGRLSDEHYGEYQADLAAWRAEYGVGSTPKRLTRDSIETLDEFLVWIDVEHTFEFSHRQLPDSYSVSAEELRKSIFDVARAVASRIRLECRELPPLEIAKDAPTEEILNEAKIWAEAAKQKPADTEPDKYMKPMPRKTIGKHFGITPSTVSRHIKKGTLTAKKDEGGKYWRVRRDDWDTANR